MARSEAEQRNMVPPVVAEVVSLLAAGDRAAANDVLYHAVHDGIDAVVLFEAAIDHGRGPR